MSNRFLKIFFLLFVSCISTVAFAQETEDPDYQQIRQAISNHRSVNYYPTLMRRYIENDTTLSLEQYRYLYYGYSLQEDFVPYKGHLPRLVEARRQFTESRGDSNLAHEMIKVAQASLDDNPFDIPAINIVAASYLQIGDTVQYRVWDIKQKGLLDAILSSGDGAEPSSAFHVIDIEHEYEVLNRLGLQIEADSLVNDNVEYLKVRENAEGEKGFYFNFGACRNIYRKKYE